MIESNVKPKGVVEIIIEDKDGNKEVKEIQNAVLTNGRAALASSLAYEIGDSYQFYIARMLFGDGGTSGGIPKYIDSSRNGLFGTTRVSKPIVSIIDSNNPTQVVFTSVVTFDEGNSYPINEMALQMANGNVYSMTTFPDLNKTSSMQITFNWKLSFI